jgi:hypothetical protein
MNPYDPEGLQPWRARRAAGSVDVDYLLDLGDPQQKHASNGAVAMSVLDSTAGNGGEAAASSRLFKRRAIKGIGGSGQYEVMWLVGELDGVRCYTVHVNGLTHVILTREDLYP